MFPHRLAFVFFLLISIVGNAQESIGLRSHSLCISPPPPPVFLAQDSSMPETGSRSIGYKIPFDTIRFNHVLGTQAFDVVVCFDGVINSSQIANADRYVDSLVKTLESIAQYNPRFKYFNVYRVAKLSNEQGAAWGFAGDTNIDNRYGSRFNKYGLPRLILPEKYDTLFADIEQFVPQYDLALNLCYDKKYGGSGWNLYDGRKVASFTLDEQTGWHLGDEVACHEMQHIMPFAGHGFLGDEYEDTLACPIYDTIPISYLISPNFTGDTSHPCKWEHCFGLPGIGFYPNAGICPGNYRPADNCIMHQVFGFPAFCPVCRENSTAWLDSMINPVYNVSPLPLSFSGSYTFKVSVDTPFVNTFLYQWLLDDTLVATSIDSLTLNFSQLSNSVNHVLKFVCTDIDGHIIDTMLRRPWITSWNLLTKDTTVGLAAISPSEIFSITPNPAKTEVSIQSSSVIKSVTITDMLGRCVLRNDAVNNPLLRTDVSTLTKGIYIVTAVTKNGKGFTRKLVVSF